MTRKKPLRKAVKLAIGAFCGLAALYGANGALIYFAQPVSVQHQEPSEVYAVYDGVSLVAMDSLRSGGIGDLSVAAAGYVNVLSDEQVIYVASDLASETYLAYAGQIHLHEYAHLVQREFIAERSGGYPSYWNPFQSAIYYGNLISLDMTLAELMPSVKETHINQLFSGLEASADCYAQPFSSPEKPALYLAPYLGENICNAEQIEIMNRLEQGIWPQALTEDEVNELTPTNILEPLRKSIPIPKLPKNN